MIFNNTTQYAKIWKVTRPKDEKGNPRKYMELQITTSEKTQDGEYINSKWYPRVIAHAFNSLKDLVEGEYKKPINLKITKSKFVNEKYTNKDDEIRYAFRFLILEANLDDSQPQNTDTTQPAPQEPEATNNKAEDDCPW